MIQSVALCNTNKMSVEGPYTSHTHPNCPTTRCNAGSRKGHHGLDVVYETFQQYTSSPKHLAATPREGIMPVSTSSQSLLASLPSFMSVFGNGSERLEVNEENAVVAHSPNRIHFKRPQHFSSPFTRRDSASTFESTESSPTTTISTLGSSLTEPSPQSPPESPDSSSPLSSFKNLRTHSVPGMGLMDQDRKEHFSTSFPTLPTVERGDSPNKKMRNMKNLSVNTSASNRHGPQLPKLGLSSQSSASHAFSAPPTPAFIVPPKVPKKKPSSLGLTITTQEASSDTQERPNLVPQTPSDQQIRTLRALQTSTNGPLFSPTVAPEGGMRLPPFSNPASSARLGKARPPLSVSPHTSFDNTASSPITRQTLDHVQEEPDYDVPLSQEVKSPAYPQGPVCIYDPYVYLYLEPSHVEARKFDVVLNVAREVKNPFLAEAEQASVPTVEEAGVQQGSNSNQEILSDANSVSEPQILGSGIACNSATDTQIDDAVRTAHSTPKATKSEPEYVHMPWDHNTNVVDDLLRLCELIDSRARQEKRVLVHCQCGVSRSASLVVAYGIYKNPQLTVQEAYDAVKNRSRWIGPNMNLIYQLSEFKTKLSKLHPMGTFAWHSWRNNLNSGRSDPASVVNSGSGSDLASSTIRITPKMSLNNSQLSHESHLPRANSFDPPGSAQLVQTSGSGDISPGPSSAPPDMHFRPGYSLTETVHSSKILHSDVAAKRPSPPRLKKVAPNLSLTPTARGDEAIEQKKAGPAGAVARDLQKVAKDLDVNGHASAPIPTPMNIDLHSLPTLSSPTANPTQLNIDIDEPVSPRTIISPMKEKDFAQEPSPQTSSPVLPAGFSSLLSRRQGPVAPRQLPLRQEPPRLVSVEAPRKTFDPDVPPTPSLLSPRAAEFTASPFHRTVAGDLAGSSVFEQGLMSPKPLDEDPRSPAQRGEAPITRSILDMI